jgi:hypothetical protein
MAGDWIKMRTDLLEDPAVIGMACALGVDEYAIVGRLHKLWSWADKHCDNGHAKSVTFVWIDRYVCLDSFSECMAAAGWLEPFDGGITFPHFDRHNGKSAKVRADATERKRKERKEPESDSRPNFDAEMSQQLCDESATREEKRREEKNKESKAIVSSDHAADSLPGHPAKPDCPHQDIIAIYHEVLPQCPQVRDWTPARATQLRARWNESPDRQHLAYWRRFFEYAGQSDFLMGRTGPKPFFADLEWMTKSGNFTKIREAKYENRSNA